MILIIDCNVLLMSSVFVWRKNKKVPISYFLLLQLFKYVKMFKPESIYVAADKGGSWRKEIYSEYKANRKPFRDSFPDIDWQKVFKEYNTLLNNLQSFTPIKVVQIEHIEGDDVISYICRYMQGKKVIVTKDKDITQLLVLPNVSVVIPAKKGKVNVYNSLENNVVEDKIKNGDKSDNIPKAKSFSQMVRNQILIDLLNLPIIIESTIRAYLDSIIKNPNKKLFCSAYPFKFIPQVYNLLREEKNK